MAIPKMPAPIWAPSAHCLWRRGYFLVHFRVSAPSHVPGARCRRQKKVSWRILAFWLGGSACSSGASQLCSAFSDDSRSRAEFRFRHIGRRPAFPGAGLNNAASTHAIAGESRTGLASGGRRFRRHIPCAARRTAAALFIRKRGNRPLALCPISARCMPAILAARISPLHSICARKLCNFPQKY
jgi:hypothetical protein